MMEEFKSTIISCGSGLDESSTSSDPKTEAVKDVLYNRTTMVIQQEQKIESVPVEKISQEKKFEQKLNNPNLNYFPKFYVKELHRSRKIVWTWAIITLICTVLSTIALVAIIKNPGCNNWVALTLIPAEGVCIACLVMRANKFVQFRSEARTIDFSTSKPITINIQNLYKRLKTAHIDVNWFCSLTYLLSLAGIGATFLTAGCVSKFNLNQKIAWGDISIASWSQIADADAKVALVGGWVFVICLIIFIAAFFTSFILHIVLLVTNHSRAGQIDTYYGIAIVEDEKIQAIKKQKNKRDGIIFMACVLVLVLIGILIYRSVKNKKQTNNITINNV